MERGEATDALAAIRRIDERSAAFDLYDRMSPHLLVWGSVWLLTALVSVLAPQLASVGRLAFAGVGAAASIIVARRIGRPDRRLVVSATATALFICATLAVLDVWDQVHADLLASLTLAFLYGLAGIWRGRRLVAAGAVLAAITVAGWTAFPAQYQLWNGVVGGAFLMLAAGLIRRR